MSVDQLPSGKARPAKPDAQFVRYGEYVDQQIESTRRTVKVVDVLTALLTIVVGTMGFLLVAAAVEHWLVPGGYNVALRLVLFALLFTCLTFYSTRKLWPLVRGSINPAYAAQAIEQDNPTLKNSLLNLLLFREHRDDVTDAVYETLEQQAATRLHRVPIDSAVDRTHLLRLGYALIAILAVVALYKILSPKDPFASAERVLMPWARIAAPSRVSIENIEPGHVTLSRGETLQVAADVRGIGEDDPVVVKFTTADGQAVDRPAAMKPSDAGLRFTGQIPPAGESSPGGVAQDLRYYIEAGDARSLEYKVTVISAPTITVERVDYDYPEYTGFDDRSIERLGDIRAIEGTKVTIHARANQTIDEAAIDFQADGRRDVQLTTDGEQGRAAFTLELRDDRQTPRFTSYVLRFTGSDGRPNRDPVKYPIDTLPDLQPEAAILAPQEKTRDVRLDETLAIEIEARDPDFALAEVRLEGESAGRKIFHERLLTKRHNGRFTGRLLFTPGKHELHPGDVVRYWVTVRDNRAPQANEATTDSQTLRVVGPDPRQPGQPPQDRIAQRDEPGEQQQSQQGEQQNQQPGQEQSGEGQQGQAGGESSDTSQGGEQGQGQESGESSSEGNSGESGGQGEANQSNENGQGEQSSQPQNSEQQSGGESGGAGQSSASEQGGQSGHAQQREGGNEQSGEGNKAGEQQRSQDGSQAESQSSRENEQGSQDNAQREGGAGEQSDSSPVSSEGDNDGEAFERIQEFMKKEGQLPKDSQQPQPGANEQSASEQGQQQQSSSDQSQSSESAAGESSSEPSKSEPSESADAQNGEQAGESGEQGNNSQSSNDSAAENGASQSGDSQDGSADPQAQSKQPGGESSAGDAGEKTKEPVDGNNQQQPGGGQETQSEGESGAGNQAERGQAPPESLGEKSPESQVNEKWQQDPSGENEGEQQENPDAGRGERQSNSHGEQGGEQTGAAEENKAQKSERDGTGSSGQNQSADEGMGESSEQGAGRNSSSGGQDAQANERTGQSSENRQGEGSQQREGEGSKSGGKPGNQEGQQQGESQGGEQGERQQGETGEQGKQHGEQGQQGEQQQSKQSGGEQGASNGKDGGEDAPAREAQSEQSNEAQGARNPGLNSGDGAGRVPEGVMQPSGATGDAPGADAANLDYARKQTDLVLETLAEQMKREKVDQRLLEKLGWTEADMRRFVERWQQLKAAADANTPDANEAQRELDDALRSLGLRRGELRQSAVIDDQNRNLRQGYRGAVPLEYQERLRAYNQGVSRARPDAE